MYPLVSEEEQTQDDQFDDTQRFKRFIYRLCGIPLGGVNEYAREECDKLYRQTFMQEDTVWRKVVNVNAMISLIVVAFLVGYFR